MKKTKSLMAILIILCMVLAFIPFKVFATGNSYTITFNIAQNSNGYHDSQTNTDVNHTIAIVDQHLQIDGQFVDPKLASDTSANFNGYTLQEDNGNIVMTITNGEAVVLNFNTANRYVLRANGQVLTPDSSQFSGVSNVQVEDYFDPNPGNPPQEEVQGNKTATLKIKGGEGSYEDTYFDEETQSEATREVPYSESYKYGGVAINDGNFVDMEQMEESTDGQGKKYIQYDTNYNGQDTDTTVNMTFATLFINKFVGTIKVNNSAFTVSDYLDYNNQDSWLNHRDGQIVQFTIPVTIAQDNIYNVEYCVEPNKKVYIGNFLWTSNPAEEYRQGPNGTQELNDDYVAHSRIEFVKVKYTRNGVTYEKSLSDLNDLGEVDRGPGVYYHEYNSGDNLVEYGYQTKEDNKAVNYDSASMTVVEGAQVTLRIIPEYGYQVTSFTINGEDVIRGNNISEFTFTVKDGNAHIGARVTKVGNDVKSSVDGISGGTIEIGDNEISTGTARLTLSDSSSTITDEKAAQFKAAVGEGYEVDSYTDISLNQVFFKGTGNDKDVWQGQEMEELNNEATIELVMDGDFDPENTKLFHNVHDGEEIEEVEYTYNKSTKRLKFKVKSFSNYALAKKVDTTIEESTTSEISTKSPKTGDDIMTFVSIFALSVLGMIVTAKINKKNKNSRRH